ncbi:hypothetical protein [Burkholderia vietnamiensis]|uniref:hypothetical protein n=1 Tax=Burkholderia vietnamiensis TaxID=60552 RepID=UPI00159422BB|nr:hypothetical protein [Burkholderia vietnamiensis]MCA8197298.1 hypothetical protein [Burkholderia vietnamiensis]UEC05406.1 hypothetical protein LK462_34935 [Burkholderia vietnamiensis]
MNLKGLICAAAALLTWAGCASAADVVQGSYSITVKKADGTFSRVDLVASGLPAMSVMEDPVSAASSADVGACSWKADRRGPRSDQPGVTEGFTLKQDLKPGTSVAVGAMSVAGNGNAIQTLLIVNTLAVKSDGVTKVGDCMFAQGMGESHELRKVVTLKEGETASWEFGKGGRVTVKLNHVDVFHDSASAPHSGAPGV